jgi:hypothetical protein
MARILLITTGSMEERALGRSLQRLFPDHEFVSKPRIDGFTSAPLPPQLSDTTAPLNLSKFAATLIGTFDPGNRRDRPRPDFVLAIEDVELCNADDPQRITTSLRQTLEQRLADWPGGSRTVDKLRRDLLDKVSFHLMAPMTEALFFADEAALARATAPGPDRTNCFDAGECDVEAFSVADPDYLDAPVDRRCGWRKYAERAGHPKAYLSYLTDPGTGGRYRETTHGASALAALDWSVVTRRPEWTRFVRSLLRDLGDMLGPAATEIAESIDAGEPHHLTWPPPRDRVLRNL